MVRAGPLHSGPSSCLYSPECVEGEFCELRQSRMLGSSLQVALFLYHRLDRLSGGSRVCVPMHNLPPTLFRSKDHRNPQSDGSNIHTSANLGSGPLHPHDVGKLISYVLLYGLE